jgi:GrpB-like predicted nucleotidyltransferase (UPF0157 family)
MSRALAGMNPHLDESVELSEASEQWPALFEAERTRLQAALAIAAEQIEHIGSTAVAGLLAKPILDIQLGWPRYPPPRSVSQATRVRHFQRVSP